jgi:2-dehydropantoate 2-reductase
MRTAVLGAGAVGCFYGGMLARAGREVVLIGRPAHVDEVNRNGLHMETLGFDEHVRVAASTAPDAIAGAGLVLCCVKSNDTRQAATEMGPHLAADAIVLSLQNGYDNAERLQAALGRPVHPAVVYVATEMAGPGHLRHHGRGELVIGPFDRSAEVIAEFAVAGVPVTTSDNVAGALWAKLIINCVYNGLSAITQLPYGRIAPGEGIAGVMENSRRRTPRRQRARCHSACRFRRRPVASRARAPTSSPSRIGRSSRASVSPSGPGSATARPSSMTTMWSASRATSSGAWLT